MSHKYLLDLNEYIETRMTSLIGGAMEADVPSPERCQVEGRLAALREFQSLLCREFYPKLPKRIYRRLAASDCECSSSRRPECFPGTAAELTLRD